MNSATIEAIKWNINTGLSRDHSYKLYTMKS